MTVSICSQVTNSGAKRRHHRTPSHTNRSVNIFLTRFDSALSDADETGCFSEETVQRCGPSVTQSLLTLITVCVPRLEAEISEAEKPSRRFIGMHLNRRALARSSNISTLIATGDSWLFRAIDCSWRHAVCSSHHSHRLQYSSVPVSVRMMSVCVYNELELRR